MPLIDSQRYMTPARRVRAVNEGCCQARSAHARGQTGVGRCARPPGIDSVEAATSTIRRWVKDAAERVREQGGGDRWQDVSSHDLRRSWATHHRVERQVDIRTMMAVGGWSDYSAIEPCLKEPTESRVGEALGAGT